MTDRVAFMDYAGLESELVTVLTAYFTATVQGEGTLADVFAARVMPENQDDLLQQYDKGMCNVQYVDSVYADPASTSIIEQEETVKVSVFMQTNSMKDATQGGYLLIASVKEALIGYKPVDARTRMWISGYGGWEIADGEVAYYLEFSFRTVNVQTIVDTSDADTTIDSGGTVTTGGGLLQVESCLYE